MEWASSKGKIAGFQMIDIQIVVYNERSQHSASVVGTSFC
jgi:hypothetical protein